MHFPEPNIQRAAPSKHDVYYEGNKKNEMNELKIYFKTVLSNPDLAIYRKEVIKKIINLTTQGVDTSRFYPEMVIASGTKDVVEKKLIFFYLTIYSHYNADIARMAINTFTKDTCSPNISIRALAIRHLSNLRFKGRQEYQIPILMKGLEDGSSTVKRACFMGLTKLITQQNRKLQQPERDQALLDQLYKMIRNEQPDVVCCLIEAINQIQSEGIAMSKKLTYHLLDMVDSFQQIQLAIVLRYVELYDPKQDDEIPNILNKLDSKLKSQNLSLALSIIKIYLKYGLMKPDLMPQIQLKTKSCLLLFVSSGRPEISYIAMKQIEYIIKKYKVQIYIPSVKTFYVYENDPTFNKIVKIRLMQMNCCKANFTDIINQFTQYIRDSMIIDSVMQAFDSIILRMQLNQAKIIIKTLNDMVVNINNRQYICNAAIRTIRTFLRKYPQEFRIFQHTFYIYAKGVSTTSARCAMVEIIGDFGEQIEDAVELIVWSESNIQDQLIIALLRANVKLFFKRPIEMLNIITNLFRQVLTDQQTRLPVKDYASLLYRGLEHDIQNFKTTFLSHRSYSQGIQLAPPELQTNSLETVYGRPSSQWLIDKNKYIELLEQINYDPEEVGEIKSSENILTSEQTRQMVNIDSKFVKIQPEHIDHDFELSAQLFQQKWEQYEIGSSMTRMVKQIQYLDEPTLQELFKLWGVSLLASLDSEEGIKQYYYFRLLTGDIIYVELNINKQVETLGLIVKTEEEELAGFASKYIQLFLKENQIL